MSMDQQDWAPGQVPAAREPGAAPVQPFGQPVAPYARTVPLPYGETVAPAGAPQPRDPYAYAPVAPSTPPAPGSYPQPPVNPQQPAYPQTAYAQTSYPLAGYPPSSAPPYPHGPNPQPYVQGAYGQRSAYGEYTPTAYGASGYQPMPFAALPRLAGFGSRVAALLIDGAPGAVLLTGALVYMLTTATPTTDAYGTPTVEPTGVGVILMIAVYLLVMLFSLWNRTFLQGRTGQSLGKKALNIRLVRESTMAPPGALLTFGREVAHYVDSAIYIGYLWPLWDAKNQTLSDKICSTVVIADS